MKKLHIVKVLFLLLFSITENIKAQQTDLKLWYNKPAEKWTDALPIGNGKLGAMIYGGIAEEHIQFNEATLWTGRPRHYAHAGAYKYLQRIRQLLFDGKQAEAEAMAEEHFMGTKDPNDSIYNLQKTNWLKKVKVDEIPAGVSFNDNNWQQMQLPTLNGWETAGLEGLDGAVWFRVNFNLPIALFGKDLFIDLGRIRDVDFTYINGKQIGSSEGISNKRHYLIPSSLLKSGKNILAVQVINYFDKGGFTGLKSGKPFIIYSANKLVKDTITLNTKWKYWIQNDAAPAYPQYEASYQPFGDFYFQFLKQKNISDYHRELNIENAISSVTYLSNGVKYKREYFASNPNNIIGMHLTANNIGSINLNAFFKTLHKNYHTKKINDSTLALYVQVKDGALKGVSYLNVNALHGKIEITNDKIIIENADEVTFYLTAATNFINYKNVSGNPEKKCRQILQAIKNKIYDFLKASHIKDYQQLFNTFSVKLGNTTNRSLPTDERILKYSHDSDPALIALYMQYGRYLLISSSRQNGMPANLQGIWNESLTPSWGSKYTTNINLEMNYWPVDLLNLSPCSHPLFNMIKGLAIAGKATAKEHYNAEGWVLHHNTDIWLGTAPINASNHGIWVSGAAWLCHHIWEHYLFTGDKNFLLQNYAAMKNAAIFFTDYLIKDPKTGYLISTPSNSPEHGGLVAGPTMDHQIIRDLFKNCISAAKILKVDKNFSKVLQNKYDSIAPNKIGRLGNLQEWMEDKEDTTEHHRHQSQLWGVYPGTDITWAQPNMMKAARQSLLYRGDDGTGWSIAWKVNLWDRFLDGEHALLMLDKLLSSADGSTGEKGGVYKNLFDAHPPFQIDGNFGGAAGIAEMLLQSQNGKIKLLPALPSALKDGEVKGICARGGFELNFKWQNGKLQQVELISNVGNDCILEYKSNRVNLITEKGKHYLFDGNLKQLK